MHAAAAAFRHARLPLHDAAPLSRDTGDRLHARLHLRIRHQHFPRPLRAAGPPLRFHSVRVVVSGAEKLNAEVASVWLHKFGLRIMEGYGATECAPVLSLNTPLR